MVKLWEVLRGWAKGKAYRNRVTNEQVLVLETIVAQNMFLVERGEELMLFRRGDTLTVLPKALFVRGFVQVDPADQEFYTGTIPGLHP